MDKKGKGLMTLLTSRKLRTLLTWGLFVSLTFIAGVIDSSAQGARALQLQRAARLRRGSRASQAPQVPASGPTWTLLLPAYSDPDLSAENDGHSAVYDPGSNTM